MQQRATDRLPVNEAKVYRGLAVKHGRTPKDWEYRMQNIYHVLDQFRQSWIEGLKPAKNVGAEVTGTLAKRLAIGPPTAVSPATLAELERQHMLVDESGFFVPENVEDQQYRVPRTIVQREGQQEFRMALLTAYEGKCEMTGHRLADVLEAAHIHRYLG